MKKIYTLFIFSVITLSVFSQAYKPMLKENKTWDVYHGFWNQAIPENYLDNWFLEGDTTLYGRVYQKLQVRLATAYPYINQFPPSPIFYDSTYSFSGKLLREDTLQKKVWTRDLWGDTTELLVYDFSVNVGDTMKSLWNGGWGPGHSLAIVDSIGLATLNNNEITRIFYITPIDFGVVGFQPFYVIEGIGSPVGFYYPFENVFEHTAELTCVNDDGITLYSGPYGNTGSCYTPILSVNSNKVDIPPSFELYPNPNNGEIISIEGKGLDLVEIYNIHGQLIKAVAVENEEPIINLENQSKGIYLVKAQFNNGEVATKKLMLTR